MDLDLLARVECEPLRYGLEDTRDPTTQCAHSHDVNESRCDEIICAPKVTCP